MSTVKSDIEIAREAKMKPIMEIGTKSPACTSLPSCGFKRKTSTGLCGGDSACVPLERRNHQPPAAIPATRINAKNISKILSMDFLFMSVSSIVANELE